MDRIMVCCSDHNTRLVKIAFFNWSDLWNSDPRSNCVPFGPKKGVAKVFIQIQAIEKFCTIQRLNFSRYFEKMAHGYYYIDIIQVPN
jgi:hypothetical protein